MSFSILLDLGLWEPPKLTAYEKVGINKGSAELNFSKSLVRQRLNAKHFGGDFPDVRMPANAHFKIIILVMHPS